MSDEELARYVGTRLRMLRRDRRLTQEQVTAALGPGLKLWRYERGECLPSLKTLCGLAAYYQVSFDALLPRPAGAGLEAPAAVPGPLMPFLCDRQRTVCFYSHGQSEVNQPVPSLAAVRAASAVAGDYVERAIAAGITVFLCNSTNFGLLAADKVIRAKKKNHKLQCVFLDPYPVPPNVLPDPFPSWETLRKQADCCACLSQRRTQRQLYQYYDFLAENTGRVAGIYTPLQGERSQLLRKARAGNIPCGNLYPQYAEQLKYERNILRYERRVEKERTKWTRKTS